MPERTNVRDGIEAERNELAAQNRRAYNDMKGLREIKHRIRAIRNTAQITRAMHLVAASKMKRAQNAALSGRPYNLLLAEIIGSLAKQIDLQEIRINHPFFEERPIVHRGILVIGTDKGLCGTLNQNLYKQIHLLHPQESRFIVVGNKPMQYLSRMHCNVLGQFCVPDTVHFSDVQKIAEFVVDAFKSGEIDTVEILFPRFKNVLVQETSLQNLLPMQHFHEHLEEQFKNFESRNLPSPDPRPMLMEPGPQAILDQLPLLFLKKALYQILLETKASEHSARMVAMKAATDNAETILDDLTLEFNKARQSSITQEIVEISASQHEN